MKQLWLQPLFPRASGPVFGLVLRLACLLVLVTGLAACSGQSLADPDGDESRLKARPFRQLDTTNDRLDAKRGDVEDWRIVLPEQNGRLNLRVEISRWEESKSLSVLVSGFDEAGNGLFERPLNQSANPLIEQVLDVQAGRKYFIRFKAIAGSGQYIAVVGAGTDPCAECTDKQTCESGKCVDKPCGGECADGTMCDEASNKCVRADKKAENKCDGVRCASAEFCQRSTGRCVAKPKEKEPEETPPPPDPDIDAAVIDVRDGAQGSVLTLSAGENKGVRKGATGHVKGIKGSSLVIVEVYPTRSKANCKLPASKLVGAQSASIKK
jgi:hypothetical protein